MTRLIDADALIDAYCNGCTHYRGKICRSAQRCDFESFCNEYINTMQTVDAVPSETLYNFIKVLGSITYGKERFFRQDNGMWYDRKHAGYITLDDVIRRIVDAVREIDEGYD